MCVARRRKGARPATKVKGTTRRGGVKHLPEKKTVVFTGAMIPFTIENSDAVFNFGVSVGALPFLKNGVWISMNGKIFEFDKVRKNKKLGLFEDG